MTEYFLQKNVCKLYMKDIEIIKKEFISLLTQRKIISSEIKKMQNYLNLMLSIYNEYVSKYSQSSENTHGLDSMFVQYRLLKLDYAHLTTIYKNIDNNLYCEYYKLFGIIKQYILREISDKKIKDIVLSKNYPKYKNFDYMKQYDITLLIDMHHIIISVINDLIQLLKTRNDRVSSCKKHNDGGVNLLQLIHVQTYNNNIINSKIEMFMNCLDSINVNHTHFFDNMLEKLKLCNNIPISRGIGLAISTTDLSIYQSQNGGSSIKTPNNIVISNNVNSNNIQ